MHQHRERIFEPLWVVCAVRANKAGDPQGQAEEHDGLVDDVGAEIVYGAATREGFCFPATSRGSFGAVAVEMRFEVDDPAEGVVFVEGRDGEEVGVPAAV